MFLTLRELNELAESEKGEYLWRVGDTYFKVPGEGLVLDNNQVGGRRHMLQGTERGGGGIWHLLQGSRGGPGAGQRPGVYSRPFAPFL